MNKAQENLVKYLLNHKQAVTVKEAAAWLGVSPRTVKNYVKGINSTPSGTVVFSDYKGYTIDREKARELLKDECTQNASPQNYEERAIYINNRFLREHTDQLDLYEVAESIGYGEDTIKADIVKMNKTYANFGVSYQIRNSNIVLNADEQSLRRLARVILFDSINENLIDMYTIREVFPDLDADVIKDTVERVLRQDELYINDFGMINVVLHIAITVRRLLNENSLPLLNLSYQMDKGELVYQAAEEIAFQLGQYFDIVFNEEEVSSIYLLIKANVNLNTVSDETDLQDYIGEELYEFVDGIIDQINEKYYVRINNDNFRFPFAMHIKNLIFRLKNRQRNINPVSQIIRQSYPIIFDMAVFTAAIITDHYGYKVDENELAYLALHIGGEIERQNFVQEKVSAVLLCQNYLNMNTRLSSQLMINFSDELELLAVVGNENDLKKYRYELLLSTTDVQSKQDAVMVKIPMFGIKESRSLIEEAISEVKEKKRLRILKNDFNKFFTPDLFIINNGEYDTAKNILKKCADTMNNAGVVDETFYEQILERELASTTAFPNIAIPHSLKLDAIKTSVCVMICPKGIEWGGYRIRIVLAVAVNKIDARRFGELYQALISLFDNESIIEEVICVRTFDEFERFVRGHI